MLPKVKRFPLDSEQPVTAKVLDHWPDPTSLDMDMHESYEISLMLAGEQERHFEGLVRRSTPGDAWLVPAWEPHGWRITAPETRELVIEFLPGFLADESFEGVSWLSLFATPPSQRPRARTQRMREQALAIGREIAGEADRKRWGWREAVRFGVLRLLVTLTRGWGPPQERANGSAARASNLTRIMPAVSIVHSNPSRRVSLREAAKACELSVSRFRFLFRNTMGASFGKFALRTRLGQAAHLMLSSDLSTEAVAARTGFVDGSHLHHAFSRAYSCTPAAYRERGQQ